MTTYQHLRTNAKALYIIGTLEDVWDYLEPQVDRGAITEDEADKIIDHITEELKDVRLYKINEVINSIVNLGK